MKGNITFEPVYLDGFTNKNDLSNLFQIDNDLSNESLDEYDVLIAIYDCSGYSGDAFILMTKNSKLYEVNASHCSCMGLEGQFDPEETTFDALDRRMNAHSYGAFKMAIPYIEQLKNNYLTGR